LPGSPTPQEEQLAALEALCVFVTSGEHRPGAPAAQIVTATTARMVDTTRSIVGLIGSDLPVQSAILLRGLFEDMVVSHWLMSQTDAEFLVDRFLDQQDAQALHQQRLARDTGWMVGTPIDVDALTLQQRERELVKTFGRAVTRDWWAIDAEGSRVGFREVLEHLEASSRYVARFWGGGEPLLIRWYRIVQRVAHQHVRHTPVGVQVHLPRGDKPPVPYADRTLAFYVLFCAYWTLGQQIYLQLAVEGYDTSGFDPLFADGLRTFQRYLPRSS
jgi:hypothetical protein